MQDRFINDKGFTLIEVIATLLIIAILSVVVMSRVSGRDEAQLQAEVDTLKGHLRYAQAMAMNDISPNEWGINLSGTTYTLQKFDGVNTTTPFNLPNESSATHSFSSGITVSVTQGNNPVFFDEWGRPGALTILSINGESITITANTGYIP